MKSIVDSERAAFRAKDAGIPAYLRKLEIRGLDGSLYMTRHHVVENPDGSHVLLHQIHRSDHDREFHDHPFAFRSFIVSGAYIEHTPVFLSESDGNAFGNPRAWIPDRTHAKLYKAGDWNLRPDPTAVHRVEVIEHPCITVVYRGPRVRDWGFLMEDGLWVPHQDYLVKKFGSMEAAEVEKEH